MSTPHFSKCYRDYFGVSPSEERAGVGAACRVAVFPAAATPLSGLEQARGESTFASVRL